MSELNTTKFTILARREAELHRLNGRPHSPLDSKNRKLIRINIKDIYFFGCFCSREELSRYVWR